MKYLDASTRTRVDRISKDWGDIKKEFDVSESYKRMELFHLIEALAKKWEGRQIVMLVDVYNRNMLSELDARSFPESVRIILVLNPASFGRLFPLPPSFLQVTFMTPYRSTIAISSLAHFTVKCRSLVVPEEDLGSDVEGTKPIFFDTGNDDLKTAGRQCHNPL